MSTIGVSTIKSDTLFQKAVNSTPANFVKDAPIVASVGATGAGVVAKYAIDKSQVVATVAKKGLVPAAGAGVAVLGAAMAYDGVVNDLKDNKLKAGAKVAGGSAMILAGTEVIGRSLGVESLKPLTKAAKFLTAENIIGKGVYGVGGGAAMVASGYSMKEKGVTVGNSLGMTAGAAASSVGFLLKDDVGLVTERPLMVTVGLGLGLTTYAFGKNTVKGIQEKDYTKSFFNGALGVASAVGSAHLLGNATGVKALENLGGKLVNNIPLTVGLTATTFAAGAYYMYAKDK
jgi:hypothetical protein